MIFRQDKIVFLPVTNRNISHHARTFRPTAFRCHTLYDGQRIPRPGFLPQIPFRGKRRKIQERILPPVYQRVLARGLDAPAVQYDHPVFLLHHTVFGDGGSAVLYPLLRFTGAVQLFLVRGQQEQQQLCRRRGVGRRIGCVVLGYYPKSYTETYYIPYTDPHPGLYICGSLFIVHHVRDAQFAG